MAEPDDTSGQGIDPGEDRKDPDAPSVGLERGRGDDALYADFGRPSMDMGLGEDGLPKPALDQMKQAHAPPLAIETFVCMADTRKFVIREEAWGEVLLELEPELVEQSPNGRYYVLMERLVPFLFEADYDEERYKLERVGVQRWVRESAPIDWSKANPKGTEETYRDAILRSAGYVAKHRVLVEPVRPACKHYARQFADLQDTPDNQFADRLCTARRTADGFFMGLRDQQMFACELRSPPDPVSARRLEIFDQNKILLGEERRNEPGAFDVDRALAEASEHANEGLVKTGIFAEHR